MLIIGQILTLIVAVLTSRKDRAIRTLPRKWRGWPKTGGPRPRPAWNSHCQRSLTAILLFLPFWSFLHGPPSQNTDNEFCNMDMPSRASTDNECKQRPYSSSLTCHIIQTSCMHRRCTRKNILYAFNHPDAVNVTFTQHRPDKFYTYMLKLQTNT